MKGFSVLMCFLAAVLLVNTWLLRRSRPLLTFDPSLLCVLKSCYLLLRYNQIRCIGKNCGHFIYPIFVEVKLAEDNDSGIKGIHVIFRA